MIVSVHAFDQRGSTVDPQFAIYNLDMAKPDVQSNYFGDGLIWRPQGDQQGIEMRRFGCPRLNFAHRFCERERGASPRHGCEITFLK